MHSDLEFDSSHPIPDVTVIDVTVSEKGGGATYGLVVARPLVGDERSLKRLQAKMRNYVHDFFSDEARTRFGTPAGRMGIVVHIHKDSAIEVFDRLRQYEEWIRGKNIEFSLKRIDTP